MCIHFENIIYDKYKKKKMKSIHIILNTFWLEKCVVVQ